MAVADQAPSLLPFVSDMSFSGFHRRLASLASGNIRRYRGQKTLCRFVFLAKAVFDPCNHRDPP